MTAQLIQTPSALLNANPIVLYNVTWEQLEQMDAALIDTGARLTYLDGMLEIMAPLSEAHEEPKSTVRSLVEVFCRERDIRFYIHGSQTRGKKKDGARAEPDESYSIGVKKSSVPDLVIKVTVTSGGIDKLEIYSRLKVPEVWFWEDGTIDLYCLRLDGRYEKSSCSELLPDLDISLVAEHSRMADQYDAITSFIKILRENA
ncbi:MAG: Uma2 family endonuclease [Alkalinema sp. RU_4_3]|nr:Uma2 family endonuclease [Alkalinema sp. RU_4_3]